ncbi:acyl carrier protein [Helicobacter sp.]|uniref:acyl carrier protein n=1 Tax=Helicobacter sp. TaxID=218 RepID=UPI0025C4A616|nr:acyl carrier protein [Helicobacter sp.]MCI5633345.1 acyl carrier protein [Helicobacter sp.]MDY5556897.1 acyl carrier protein [Helicobacter sp.]
MQREEIFELLKKLLIELFEVDASKIKLESKIYEDLEIDSIDAIDMIDYIKKQTGYRMEAAHFKEVRTLGDIVEVVFAQLNKDSAE